MALLKQLEPVGIHPKILWHKFDKTQEEIALEIGVSPRTYRRWLAGERNPSRPARIRAAELYKEWEA